MYTYGAGSPGTYGTYLQEGQPLSYAPRFSGLGAEEAKADSGSSWADIINATMAATAGIFQMQTQAKLAKQAQHQAERDRAAQLEIARAQATYRTAMPGTVATTPRGNGMTKALMIGGVLVVGGGLLFAMRKRRR
jgi:hypothetical protein